MASTNRRDEILQVAAGLFAQKGFKNTTIKHIAEAAGVRSSSLYHHFPSKEAIVDEILATFHQDLFGKYYALIGSERDARAKLVEAIQISFDATSRQRDAVAIFENEAEHLGAHPGFEYLAERNAESRDIWIRLLEEGVSTGALRPDLDVRVAYRFIRDTVWGAPRWYRSDEGLAPQHVAEQFLAIFLDGTSSR